MFRLTREVRFAINPEPDGQLSGRPTNSYGGFPTLVGLGRFYTVRVGVTGPLDDRSQYLINIKRIDELVRQHGIPLVESAVVTEAADHSPALLAKALVERLGPTMPAGVALAELSLSLSPFLSYSCLAREMPMVRLSQKFEFSATHRLHNPALSDDENCRTYGKCNNPHGHGHNYEVQVTLKGELDGRRDLVHVPDFERIVATTVIDRLDHKNLNVEVPEFRDGLIPSVENIAMTIYRMLKPKFADSRAQLAAVTVWETPKTWCEYSE